MKQKKKVGWKKVALVITCVVLALLLLGMIGVTVALEWFLASIPRLEPDQQTISPEEYQASLQETDPIDPNFTGPELDPDQVWQLQPSQPQATPAPSTSPKQDRVFNLLLIGQDRRPGESRQRSDAMILCTINFDQKTLVLTSFQRDTYVKFPDGHQDYKLNAAYQWGGMQLLDDTLALNFGVQVDANVEVDFTRFVQVVDMAGGVHITLTEAEAANMRKQGFDLEAGLQKLNGEQALGYSRIRKIDNDFGRTNRQRKVLQSLLQSCKSSSPKTLMNLLESVLPMLATDMTDQQIVSLATEMLPILGDLTVVSQHIPAKGTYVNAKVKGMSVLVPDLAANREILEQTLSGR